MLFYMRRSVNLNIHTESFNFFLSLRFIGGRKSKKKVEENKIIIYPNSFGDDVYMLAYLTFAIYTPDYRDHII